MDTATILTIAGGVATVIGSIYAFAKFLGAVASNIAQNISSYMDKTIELAEKNVLLEQKHSEIIEHLKKSEEMHRDTNERIDKVYEFVTSTNRKN